MTIQVSVPLDAEDASPTYIGFDDAASLEIHNLATSLSRMSRESYEKKGSFSDDLPKPEADVPLFAGTDPRLDPNSPDFDSKCWVANMRRLIDSDVDYYKPASLGVAYKDLRVYGDMAGSDYQSTVSNSIQKALGRLVNRFRPENTETSFDILKPMEGLIKPGEVTVVLGRPGAGCSTLLKTISCHTHGFHVDEQSTISYSGLSPNDIKNHLRGQIVYCAETETHFPNLTVGQTLQFAARMKTPHNRPPGVDREMYAQHMSDVVMATYGLSHTKHTKVGNDFVRGISGGERKRVSIAEVSLVNAPLQCWDNSTRGLDSATALEFITSLKTSANVLNDTPLIAIYQCSQDTYDLFDKVIVLYEGYQIFFGSSKKAKQYFLDMGYLCAARNTTADFLTSLTNPAERIVAPGFENRVPRTPGEFYDYWRASPERKALLEEIDEYLENDGHHRNKQLLYDSHNATQANHAGTSASYTVSFPMQVRYVVGRNFLRMKGDPSITMFTVFGNSATGLIISSVFFNLQPVTGTFYYRTAIMFFAVLFNAYASVLEIFSLYEARPIIEKHKNYSLYRPSADALASVVSDLPVKIVVCITFNLVVYFMVNFRRDAGHFFFYLLVNFSATMAMSHLFRCIGASTKSLSSAMTPASILLLGLTTFAGFAIPTPNMLGWCRWINYIDPIAYAFDALISNEFHGRDFSCSMFVPAGPGYPTSGENVVCSALGSVPGSSIVNGDDFIYLSYRYQFKNRWRNWGINVAFAVFFLVVYVIIVENSKAAVQGGEILVFQRKSLQKIKKQRKDTETGNIEKIAPEEDSNIDFIDNKLLSTADIFHWRNLTYTVKVKSEERTLLNDVDGWVKPGQVTALMGASGAGKTTLLNALSDRLTTGVVTSGERMVNGGSLDDSFQRSIGYVQQQDLHLQTSTVREALLFSANLRQPYSVSKKEKEAYVDNIIHLLEMEKYANAVVGVPGEGLNVEQRKRLTIGVELAAKPKVLLFLDEPTSGLDSQTAWSICRLIRKLADHGQAILCTIHQPSAILLQEFDRLLFLKSGGETVYFGDLGENCCTLISYFEKHGAPKCPADANPAEWMLSVIGAAPGSHAQQDYFQVWLQSEEYRQMCSELDIMKSELRGKPTYDDPDKYREFASPLFYQYFYVCKRVFEQYWRTPSYIYSKFIMAIGASAFNGFTFFRSKNSIQGLQNQMLSVFMLFIVLTTLIHQYIPLFVTQRALYEARERPSKTFSWKAFIAAQITVEVPFQVFAATLAFFNWYYPVGLYRNAAETGTTHQRGALMWLILTLMFIFSSTLGQLSIAFNEIADNAANIVSLLLTMCLTFCGVLASSEQMPRFWIFMYRCNPLTYLVSSILSTGLANATVRCASQEYLKFEPFSGQTCGQYMGPYIQYAHGYLVDENATENCQYCVSSSTNQFLSSIGASYDHVGRDIGIFIAFIVFNMAGTVFFYYLARVPKGNRQRKSK